MDPIGTVISIASGILFAGISWGLLKGDVKAMQGEIASLKSELEKKASKELVDGLTSRIGELRAELDKRFDKLEAMISGK